MSLILGSLLGLGLLLTVSPLMWPSRTDGPSAAPAPFRSARDALALSGLGGVPIPVIATVCGSIATSPSASVTLTEKLIDCARSLSRLLLETKLQVPFALTVRVPLPVVIGAPSAYSVPLNTATVVAPG